MKKVILILTALLVSAAVFASGGAESSLGGQGITLAQNKPEIDAVLKAYAAVWSKANNVPVTIKSVGGGIGMDLNSQLKADLAAGDMPDIFAINGLAEYSSPWSPWPPPSTWAGSPRTTTSTPCSRTAFPTVTCPS
jgi:raffinose/stachyose/melibiose transport system substrate-binding protein